MPNYKLLTPGPLTTTDTVKKEMMFDHCTWDEDYKKITQEIRSGLLKLGLPTFIWQCLSIWRKKVITAWLPG